MRQQRQLCLVWLRMCSFSVSISQMCTGFELLFAHLASLIAGQERHWQRQFRFVHAKATVDRKQRTSFAREPRISAGDTLSAMIGGLLQP